MTTSPMDTNFSMLSTPSITGRNSPVLTPSNETMVTQVDPQLVTPQEERRETGRVKLKVYTQYWRAVGCLLSPMILLSLVAMQVTRNLTDVWLAHWVTSETGNGTSPNTSYHHLSQHQLYLDTYTDTDPTSLSVKYYLIVYGLIAVSNSFFSLIRAFLFAYGGIWAAR